MRGDPEAVVIRSNTRFDDDLYALIKAYVNQRARDAARHYTPTGRVEAYPLEAARVRLRTLLPELDTWSPLEVVAPRPQGGIGPSRASFVASTLSAGLEMVKEGALEVRQLEAFADLYLRARKAEPAVDA